MGHIIIGIACSFLALLCLWSLYKISKCEWPEGVISDSLASQLISIKGSAMASLVAIILFVVFAVLALIAFLW